MTRASFSRASFSRNVIGDRKAFAALAVLAVVLPLTPLVIFPHARFDYDWDNHLWISAYFRAYFLHHGWFPTTLSTEKYAAIPTPLFYGTLFYPLVALLSLPWNAEVGMRLLCFLLIAGQFWLVASTAKTVGAERRFCWSLATIWIWSVYALTNLYNRGALTEFFATSVLCCGLCLGFRSLLDPDPRRRRSFALIGSLLAALAVGSHPPTALIGGIMAGALALTALPLAQQPRRWPWRLLKMAMLILLVALTAAPWLWLVGNFNGKLLLQTEDWPKLFYEIDHWTSRLQPLPTDNRSYQSWGHYGTIYLDAEVNDALILLAFWQLALALALAKWRTWRRAGPMAALSLVILVGFYAVSVSQRLNDGPLGIVVHQIEFAYRLVTYINLAALALVMVALWARQNCPLPRGLQRWDRHLTAFILAWSAAGLALKLSHAMATRFEVPASKNCVLENNLTTTPEFFKAENDYAIKAGEVDAKSLKEYPQVVEVKMPVEQGPHFGELGEAIAQATGKGRLQTDVMNFPWNHLRIDLHSPDPRLTGVRFNHEAVFVDRGLHRVQYEFVPDPTWSNLRLLRDLTLAGMILFTLRSFLPPRRRSHVASAAPIQLAMTGTPR